MHEFNTYLEFHLFLKTYFNYFRKNASVLVFKAIANNVANGCNCTEDKRIAKANKYYQKLHFSYDEQNQMKLYLSATKIVFKFEGEVFLEF